MDASGTALVVGAGDSLGAALARRFAREGLKVCVVRRNAEKLQPLADAIRAAGGTVHAFGCDARREEQVVDLFARVERDIGVLEVVVFSRTPLPSPTGRSTSRSAARGLSRRTCAPGSNP